MRALGLGLQISWCRRRGRPELTDGSAQPKAHNPQLPSQPPVALKFCLRLDERGRQLLRHEADMVLRVQQSLLKVLVAASKRDAMRAVCADVGVRLLRR